MSKKDLIKHNENYIYHILDEIINCKKNHKYIIWKDQICVLRDEQPWTFACETDIVGFGDDLYNPSIISSILIKKKLLHLGKYICKSSNMHEIHLTIKGILYYHKNIKNLKR